MAKKVYTFGNAPPPDLTLVSKSEDEVKKKIGEPSDVAKTPENHVLWIYRPEWKIMPNDEGTLYVEFVDGKVAKIFQIKK
jgi:hypothetical protein